MTSKTRKTRPETPQARWAPCGDPSLTEGPGPEWCREVTLEAGLVVPALLDAAVRTAADSFADHTAAAVATILAATPTWLIFTGPLCPGWESDGTDQDEGNGPDCTHGSCWSVAYS